MIALWIILGIIAFIVILLHFSVKVKLFAESGGKPEIEVKWLFIKIFPRDAEDNGKEKVTDKKKKTKAAPSDTDFTDEQIEQMIEQANIADEQEETPQDTENIEKTEDIEETEAAAETKLEKVKLTKEQKKELKEQKKAEKAAKKAEKAAKKAEKANEESGLAKIKRYFNMAKPYIPMAWKAVKKLLKTIRFNKLDVRLVSGKDDAYEAAMAYGKLNAAVCNGISVIDSIFRVKAKNIRIDCDFNEKTFKYRVSTVVMVRPSALIAIVFCTGVNFLRIWIPQKIKAMRERRRRKKEEKAKNKLNGTELLTNE